MPGAAFDAAVGPGNIVARPHAQRSPNGDAREPSHSQPYLGCALTDVCALKSLARGGQIGQGLPMRQPTWETLSMRQPARAWVAGRVRARSESLPPWGCVLSGRHPAAAQRAQCGRRSGRSGAIRLRDLPPACGPRSTGRDAATGPLRVHVAVHIATCLNGRSRRLGPRLHERSQKGIAGKLGWIRNQ